MEDQTRLLAEIATRTKKNRKIVRIGVAFLFTETYNAIGIPRGGYPDRKGQF